MPGKNKPSKSKTKKDKERPNFLNNVEISGNVTGNIIAKGKLTITKNGNFNGDVETKDASIAGNFKGNLIATGEIEITSTGKLIGNLYHNKPLLMIQKGGFLKGEIVPNAKKAKLA